MADVIARENARALGLKRFFTGVPCIHGHVVERLVSCNACVECNAIHNRKPEIRAVVKNWYRENKAQHTLKVRKYREKNRERLDAAHKEYMLKNRDEIRAKRAAARHRDKEKIKEKKRVYREKYKEKIIAKKAADYRKDPETAKRKARDYYSANRERQTHNSREWARRNKDASMAIKRAYIARKIAAPGRHTGDDVKAILRAQKGKCAMCRVSLSRVVRHVDHIIALANGGSNDRRNLQVLCGSCNCSKGARDPIEFAQSRGMLV